MNCVKSIVLTIGFCVKDMEDTVERALRSIVCQNFPHRSTEIIIVEGFSRDRTFSIIQERLQKTDFSVRIYRDNRGLGWARQLIIDQARGEYVLWVDGDMILPDDYVTHMLEFMEKNPSIAVGGGRYGLHIGEGIVADLENLVYAVDSVFGEKGSSKYGRFPGTEGSIYRMEAIKQVGGFDPNIEGAAEDTELVYRLITRGWKFKVTENFFVESNRDSISSLWNQYAWYGYGGHFVYHKDVNMLTLWKMSPFAGFAAGLLRCSGAYTLTHRKMVFLLPLHYTFKRLAWLFGFLKGHCKGYGHQGNQDPSPYISDLPISI